MTGKKKIRIFEKKLVAKMDQTIIIKSAIAKVIELADEDLWLLMSYTSFHELKKGESVLKTGEICRSFYFVEKGYLRTWYNKDGTAINLNFTFEGAFTANLKSYKSKQPSDFTIEAGENALVWIFNLDDIRGQLDRHPQISKFVRRLAVQILLSSEAHSNLFKIYTPTERYRHIEKNNPQLLQRISLSQIASYLGVARETLSRIRGKN